MKLDRLLILIVLTLLVSACIGVPEGRITTEEVERRIYVEQTQAFSKGAIDYVLYEGPYKIWGFKNGPQEVILLEDGDASAVISLCVRASELEALCYLREKNMTDDGVAYLNRR